MFLLGSQGGALWDVNPPRPRILVIKIRVILLIYAVSNICYDISVFKGKTPAWILVQPLLWFRTKQLGRQLVEGDRLTAKNPQVSRFEKSN